MSYTLTIVQQPFSMTIRLVFLWFSVLVLHFIMGSLSKIEKKSHNQLHWTQSGASGIHIVLGMTVNANSFIFLSFKLFHINRINVISFCESIGCFLFNSHFFFLFSNKICSIVFLQFFFFFHFNWLLLFDREPQRK